MRTFLPGRKELLVGMVLAALGLGVWIISVPSVAGALFGEEAYTRAFSSPLISSFGFPLLAAFPLLAGILLPRGFWLWGLATVCLHLPADVWLTLWQENRLTESRFGSSTDSEVVSLAITYIMLFITNVVLCTIASTVGAGLRLLCWRSRGKSVRAELLS